LENAVAVPTMKKRPGSVLTCPQCGSSDLYYEAGLITGYKYHCKRCQYIGPFVIEKEIDISLEEEETEV